MSIPTVFKGTVSSLRGWQKADLMAFVRWSAEYWHRASADYLSVIIFT
jgi:hypothetical protein